jgi:hypothetical protein
MRREGHIEGPLTPAEVLAALEWHARSRPGAPPAEVSADRSSWLSPEAVARLLGSPLMPHEPPESSRVEAGQLEDHSLIELLGQLGRHQRTGRLLLWGHRETERVELHLLTGTLTHIDWSSAPFEVWRALLDDPYLGAEGLPEAFGLALSTRTPLPERLPPVALEHRDATRQLHARRRFERTFTWTRGGYRFDPAATVSVSERGQPLLRVLPGMVYCALSLEELERRLAPRLDRPHYVDPDLPAMKEALGLTDEELERLIHLGGREPLGALIKRTTGSTDAKFVRAMAYLLGELGLLVQT